MRIPLLLSFSLAWYSFGAYAQGSLRFQKTYGLEGDEYTPQVLQLPDGDLIVAGTTNSSISAGGTDLYLIRTSAQGDVLWANSYGGSGYEGIGGIARTDDGGIMVAGSSDSWASSDTTMPYLLKIDGEGDTVWSRTYGIAGGFNGIAPTDDGGFVLAGWKSSELSYSSFGDVLVIRIAADGDTLWTHVFDTPFVGSSMSMVRVTSDGDYIIGGSHLWSYWGPSVSMVLMRMAPDGTLLWANTYPFSRINDLQIAPDGRILALGEASDLVYYYPSVMRITAEGIPIDARTYFPWELGRAGMHVFDDGSFAICGDNTILRTDTDGNIAWAKVWAPGHDSGVLCGIVRATDGDLVIAGSLTDTMAFSSDALLLKTEDGLNGCGMEEMIASSNDWFEIVQVDTFEMGPIPWTGEMELVATGSGSGAITTTVCIGSGVHAAASEASLTAYISGDLLTFFGTQLNDRYVLLDGMGRTLREGRVSAERSTLPLSGIAQGVLILRVSSTGQAKRLVWPGQ